MYIHVATAGAGGPDPRTGLTPVLTTDGFEVLLAEAAWGQMRRSRVTIEQIVQPLRQADPGATPVVEIFRTRGVAGTTFDVWKPQYGGYDSHALRELTQLREENRKLKQVVATGR